MLIDKTKINKSIIKKIVEISSNPSSNSNNKNNIIPTKTINKTITSHTIISITK